MKNWIKILMAVGLGISGSIVLTSSIPAQPAGAQGHSAAAPSLYVYDFYAVWCHNCTAIKPTLAMIENKYKGAVKIIPIDIDAPENQQLVSRAAVQAVPTVVLADKRGKALQTFIGAGEVKELDTSISRLLLPAP